MAMPPAHSKPPAAPMRAYYERVWGGGCAGKMSSAPEVVVYRQAQEECMGGKYVYFARRRRACLS